MTIRVQWFEERAIEQGTDARAAAFVGIASTAGEQVALGAGIDSNTVVAAFKEIVSAVNRLPSMSAPAEDQ